MSEPHGVTAMERRIRAAELDAERRVDRRGAHGSGADGQLGSGRVTGPPPKVEALAELLARTPRLTAGYGASADYIRAAESLIERGVGISGVPDVATAVRAGDELSAAAAEFFLALEEEDEADSLANYEGPGDDDTHERAAVIASRRVRDADLRLKQARLAWIDARKSLAGGA